MPPLTPQAQDFPQWYQDVIQRADLADNGPVRGTMAILPYAFAIWEILRAELDRRFSAYGVENCYFPMLIPYSFLEREADTIAGFSPELAIVTHGGGKELSEPVVIRPTSETIINHFFAKRIQGHHDLPVVWNQWTNVVRWEQRPRLFLRTTEFLWQEGHTCHSSREEARDFAYGILRDAYVDVMRNVMAVPVFAGRKTPEERFPGAINTLTCEGLMRDRKALQMGTSHELGRTFAQAFGVTYLTPQGVREHVWQTSWGISTRLLGALIMTHGDDHGLRLPPEVAPTQVVVIAVREDPGILEAVDRVTVALKQLGIRVKADNDTRRGFGRRITDWELRGVPLRVHIGLREVADGSVELVRRDRRASERVGRDAAVGTIPTLLETIQRDLFKEALTFREAGTVRTSSIEECIAAVSSDAVVVPYAALSNGSALGRLREAKASVRCLTDEALDLPKASTKDGEPFAIVARAY